MEVSLWREAIVGMWHKWYLDFLRVYERELKKGSNSKVSEEKEK